MQPNTHTQRLPFRAWYYFRSGYSNYFAFILGLVNMYTITYYLAFQNNPYLGSIFPNFYVYVLVATATGCPLLALIGYLHMKRSRAYSSEVDVITESNPYSYKLLPGIQRECIAPLYLELLRLGRKSLSNEVITEAELRRIQVLEEKLNDIVNGGSLPIRVKEIQAEPAEIYGVANTKSIDDTKVEIDKKLQNTKID